MKLDKNTRGAMALAKYDLNQPLSNLRGNGGRIAEYNEAYDAGNFARAWRLILSTGCNTSKDNMLPPRPMGGRK